MKIVSQEPQPDGTVKIKLCMCKGNVSKCEPKERQTKVFKTKETLAKYKKTFNVA